MDNPPKIEMQAPKNMENPMQHLKLKFAEWTEVEQIIILGGENTRVKSLISETLIQKAGSSETNVPIIAAYWRAPSSKLFWFGFTYPFYVVGKNEITGILPNIQAGKVVIETQKNTEEEAVEPKTTVLKLSDERTLDPQRFIGQRKAINIESVVGAEFLLPVDRSNPVSVTISSVKVSEDSVYLSLVSAKGEKGTLQLKSDSYEVVAFKRD